MPGLGSAAAVAATSTDLQPGVSMDSGANSKPKLDPTDPRVRKLVYSMYRDMLSTCNGEANDIISKKDPAKVTQDLGVGPILESIIIKQRSTQGGGGDSNEPSLSESPTETGSSNGTGTTAMPPPPPPPPMMPGAIPASRLNSEIGPRDKGPPAAIASAMMKDKKPFTYTPGGIDLSEIRSPRMAKRIQMNALAEGVTNTPSPSVNNQQARPPCHLPPAALAAMQPQMAIPVFPQGGINTKQLHKMHKPADFSGPPPPPPPMPVQYSPAAPPSTPPVITAPPMSPVSSVASPPIASISVTPPTSPQQSARPMTPLSPVSPKSPQPPQLPRTPPPPPERAATPKSPVPSVDSFLGNSRPNSQTSYQEEQRSPMGRKSPNVEIVTGVGTGSIYIPPIQSPPPPPPLPVASASPMSTYVPPSSRPAGQTKAQAVSQNIGSIYIPPIGSSVDKMETPSSVGGGAANGSSNVIRTPQYAQGTPLPASIPSTPQLNKAPVPWMNSYNRMQNQQVDSPPYVHPGYFMPPWAAPPGARTIPIMMPRDHDQTDAGSQMYGTVDSRPSSSASSGTPPTPTGSRTPSQAATHLGRVIPIQIEREDAIRQKGGSKVIPIQVEGRPPRAQTPSTPLTPLVNPMRRAMGPAPYNTPMGLYSNQSAMEAYQRQAAEAAAAAGVDRMTIRCESPRTEPVQSKSMRVIQQAAENELKRYEQEQQMSEEDRYLMNLFKSQVDDGVYLHQTSEPRFMGSHIPSRAFKALQTALPTSPGGPDQPPPSFPAAQPGQVHHIPIRTVSQSPTPQSQGSEMQFSIQANVPPSEQKVQEPRKYMGSNIPSRTFKILQAMTADDGQSETASSTEQNFAESYDDTMSPCPSTDNVPLSPSSSQSSYPLSLSFSSSEGGGSSTFDPYNYTQNPWPDIMDQGWDPYSYMWYYWWYYASYYWAGYDMTGYEYPSGWDPNYPYCPPEWFADYSSQSEYTTAESEGCNVGDTNDARCESSGADLHKSLYGNGGEESYYSHDNGNGGMSSQNEAGGSTAPKIVIEGDSGAVGRDRRNSVDSIKDNNNSNHNDGSTSKAPSPWTECNQKPGNPIPYKTSDCDSVGEKKPSTWKVEQGNFAECNKLQNGNDNDDDDDVEDEKRRKDEDSSSSSEDEFESCCEDEQKVIERETGPCNKPFVSQNPDHFSATEEESRQRKLEFHGNYNCELNANDDDHHAQGKKEFEGKGAKEEDEDEDEKTDPGTDEDNDDDDDYGGRAAIIEEPETPSSADDSDVAPLVNEHQPAGKSSFYTNGGLSIEEYHSEESSDSAVFDYGLKKNRLSTIDEITESRASSSLFSRNLSAELDCCVNTRNLLKPKPNHHQNNAKGESEDSEESSDDELSSVSVIENKSDATRATESKREDETTSSSEEESATDDEDDDDEAAGADTAVTVRLPLKLSFTKTKSYKDITTVMVGDSEIQKTGRDSTVRSALVEKEVSQSNGANGHDEGIPKLTVTADTDEEPVVSFTLSLSRQSSREDEKKPKSSTNEGYSEKEKKKDEGDDAPDIDFWAAIKGDERSSKSSTQCTTQVESNQESKEDYNENEESSGADVDFWGTIARDRSTTHIPRQVETEGMAETNENGSSLEQTLQREQWDRQESIDYKWERDFNFWEKSSRIIETRRFSNFEITEDYESDSGIKPSGKKERTKKYTHHKRHSIPYPGWDRSSLPPRPTQMKQSAPVSNCETNEQEIKDGELSSGKPEESKTSKTSLERQTVDPYQDDADASSWWSYWDDSSKKSEKKSENNEGHAYITTEKAEPGGLSTYSEPCKGWKEDTVEIQKKESSDISVEIKLSETERNSTGESCIEDDYQSFACMQASRMEAKGSGGFSSLERTDGEVKERKSLNHFCQSDATTVTTDNEDYSSSPEIKSSLLFPSAANQEREKLIQQGASCISVSDENSDESSSRSSGTTIGRQDKSEIKKQMRPTIASTTPAGDCEADSENHLKRSDENPAPTVDTSIQIPVSVERTVEIQHEVGERTKLNGKQQQHEEHHHHPATTSAISTTSSCTCLVGDRIARAENLLWRIERFLHESLSLGSEDDSGVMTDLSRQISDVDTDVDNDLNETEFLLTAAAVAKERRGMTSREQIHIESCNFAETISSTDAPLQQKQPPLASSPVSPSAASTQVKKPRPKSDIILDSSLTTVETEIVEENNGVKMRSPSERRALRYQRAKTHSRLFQLLQDECGRDEEQEEFDYDSDVGTCTKGAIKSPRATPDCQINVDSAAVKSIHVDTRSTPTRSLSSCNNGMDDDSNNGMSPGMNDAQSRRSRLLPLPIKNLLASSVSLDSNSSPSGSSGVLSPTSPVNRDQLLADIINEFHLRNQASTLKAQSQRRISSSFPSKIFKLLQHEFGEEFYQTFDCCGGPSVCGEDSLISPCMSTNFCVNDSTCLPSVGAAVGHECTIHKSESMKEFEEATNKILTNFMLRNKPKASAYHSESPSSTATMSSQLLQDDSKKTSADFLEVPMRKKKANLARDPRSPIKSTKKS